MHKQEILTLLRSALESGTVTHEDIVNLSDDVHAGQSTPEARLFMGKRRFTASSILYLIGAIVMLIGIGTFVFNFWSDLSGLVKVMITLGLSIAAFVCGILLRDNEDIAGVAAVMQVVSTILAPIGVYVALDQIGVTNLTSLGWATTVSIGLFVIYFGGFLLFRSTIFAVSSLIFGIAGIYSGVGYVIDITGQQLIADTVFEYLTLAIGAGLLFLGNAIEQGPQRIIRGLFYWLGAFGVYLALLLLGGYKPTQSYVWEWISIFAAVGGLYLSNITNNRSLLKATALFIFILIGKYTAEYFADSLGWPIALIIGGLCMIAAGFGVVKFSKKIQKTA